MDVLVTVKHGNDFVEEVEVEQLCRFVMEAENKPANTEVSISFVSNDEIAKLNEAYRGIVGPTDVLSFECDSIEDEVSAHTAAEQPFELGDIIIAPDIAAAQSSDYGTSVVEELELLLVHGMLHLFGWDHIEDAEAEKMEAREKDILAAWRAR